MKWKWEEADGPQRSSNSLGRSCRVSVSRTALVMIFYVIIWRTARKASGRASKMSVFEVLLLGLKGFEHFEDANYYILSPFSSHPLWKDKVEPLHSGYWTSESDMATLILRKWRIVSRASADLWAGGLALSYWSLLSEKGPALMPETVDMLEFQYSILEGIYQQYPSYALWKHLMVNTSS